MKIGIVGLPNVGKSTLFKALTKNPVDINNYPFCTIEPNVGVVRVPDERLDKLAEMSKSKKIVPTVIEFVDIAGLVRGASEGEGLGNKFLANIREVDAIAQVVRVFKDPKITHVHNAIDPENDISIINTELILADLETAGKTLARLEKELKGGKKFAAEQLVIVKEIKKNLEKGNLARSTDVNFENENAKTIIREMSLLTMKPFVYVYNVSEAREKLSKELEEKEYVELDVKIEEELGEMSQEEITEMHMKSSLDQLVVKAYQILGLITYLTTGEDETRAWTIKKNSTAPQAGAAIHTDFEEKFIRADIIHWEKLLEAGSWSKARELGWLRTEGKEYIVQDGDVIEFKI
jgi:ribosome-binding ATPase